MFHCLFVPSFQEVEQLSSSHWLLILLTSHFLIGFSSHWLLIFSFTFHWLLIDPHYESLCLLNLLAHLLYPSSNGGGERRWGGRGSGKRCDGTAAGHLLCLDSCSHASPSLDVSVKKPVVEIISNSWRLPGLGCARHLSKAAEWHLKEHKCPHLKKSFLKVGPESQLQKISPQSLPERKPTFCSY